MKVSLSDNSERKMLVPSNSPIKNPTKEVIAPAHNLFPFLCVYSDKYEGLLKKVLLVSMFLKVGQM